MKTSGVELFLHAGERQQSLWFPWVTTKCCEIWIWLRVLIQARISNYRRLLVNTLYFPSYTFIWVISCDSTSSTSTFFKNPLIYKRFLTKKINHVDTKSSGNNNFCTNKVLLNWKLPVANSLTVKPRTTFWTHQNFTFVYVWINRKP